MAENYTYEDAKWDGWDFHQVAKSVMTGATPGYWFATDGFDETPDFPTKQEVLDYIAARAEE